MKRLPNKDIIATGSVGAAVLVYGLWVADLALPGMSALRVTAAVILALGFLASAVAVVPGFGALLHGSRTYLAGTSVLGLAALIAGVVTLWTASGEAMAVLMALLVALWLISTAHHAMLAPRTATPVGREVGAAAQRSREPAHR